MIAKVGYFMRSANDANIYTSCYFLFYSFYLSQTFILVVIFYFTRFMIIFRTTSFLSKRILSPISFYGLITDEIVSGINCDKIVPLFEMHSCETR